MSIEKRIEEMAADICLVKHNCNDVCNPINTCNALKYARRAYEAGYRKQEWISVDEMLPSEDGWYITYTNANGKDEGVIAQRLVTATVRGKKTRRWEWQTRVSPWIVTLGCPFPNRRKENDMDEYIEAKKVLKILNELVNDCPDKEEFYNRVFEEVDTMPAANVAPKSEFASEIFWEIDKLLTRIITDDENGTQFIGVDMQKYYALKKKYTEERT